MCLTVCLRTHDHKRVRDIRCWFWEALVVACYWMSEGDGDTTKLLGFMRRSKTNIAADRDGSTRAYAGVCNVAAHTEVSVQV